MLVAVDCETSGLFCDDGARCSAVSVSWQAPIGSEAQAPVVVAFPFDQGTQGKPEGQQGSLLEQDENLGESDWAYLLDWLKEQWLTNQNIKFDLHHLRIGTRFWPGVDLLDRVVWDTMLASKELDPLHPTSLKPTAERLKLTGGGERDEEEAVKGWLKAHAKSVGIRYSDIQGRYDLIPWNILGPYAAKDAELALMLTLLQQQRFESGEGSMRFMKREMDKMEAFYQMEVRGIGYDASKSLEIAGVLEGRIEKLRAGLPFEPEVNAAKRYFYGVKGMTPYKATEKGAPSLDDEVIKKMVKDGVEWAEEFQEIRKLQTAVSMWYEGYAAAIGDDGRLRGSFRQTKVVSGRASHERVNLQAIPHDYRLELLGDVPTPRQLVRPAVGRVLWELDLSQAELRVAAKMAKAKRMLELIEEGADAHGDTARELFGVEPGTPQWFPKRQVSKRANFSLIFGAGGPTLDADVRKQTGIELGRTEADRIVQGWRHIHPEFQRAIYRQSEIVRGRRYVLLANGRPRWFAPHEDSHKAFNQKVQGSIAELVADWMIEVEARWPGFLVLQIHDSLVVEVAEGLGEIVAPKMAAVGKRLAEAMFDVPMEVEHARWGEK